jgi:hypothetical protein
MKSKKKSVRPKRIIQLRTHWRLRLAPKERICIIKEVGGVMIIQNRGPGTVLVAPEHGNQIELPRGQLRVVTSPYDVHFECVDDEFADVEFNFTPK